MSFLHGFKRNEGTTYQLDTVAIFIAANRSHDIYVYLAPPTANSIKYLYALPAPLLIFEMV